MLPARIISRLFNPLFITLFYMIIVLNINSQMITTVPDKARWMLLGMIMLTSCIIPGIIILFLGQFSRKALKFSPAESKVAVLIIATVFNYLSYYMLGRLQISPVYTLFLLGITTLTGICILITIFWNISIYMTGMGALAGALSGITMIFNLKLQGIILLIIAFSGMVGYARLAMDKHRPAEIYSGFLLGFVGMIIHFYYV